MAGPSPCGISVSGGRLQQGNDGARARFRRYFGKLYPFGRPPGSIKLLVKSRGEAEPVAPGRPPAPRALPRIRAVLRQKGFGGRSRTKRYRSSFHLASAARSNAAEVTPWKIVGPWGPRPSLAPPGIPRSTPSATEGLLDCFFCLWVPIGLPEGPILRKFPDGRATTWRSARCRDRSPGRASSPSPLLGGVIWNFPRSTMRAWTSRRTWTRALVSHTCSAKSRCVGSK